MIPLLAVLGPTASGKSRLAEWLATHYCGELINADASAMYRELEVGVTKPDAQTRSRFSYHLLDIVSLCETITMRAYQIRAQQCIHDIHARGRLPILVGGSSLYIRALLEGYHPVDIIVDESTRRAISLLSFEERVDDLRHRDPLAFSRIDIKNPRRVTRALELAYAYGGPVPLSSRTPPTDFRAFRLILLPSPEVQKQRIRLRTESIWPAWREEVVLLEKKGLAPWLELRKPIGYDTVRREIRGELTRQQAWDEITRSTCRLAKKQRTWLRKDEQGRDYQVLRCVDELDSHSITRTDVLALVDDFLNRLR